jgi:Na+-transporting methylmalonyl-CoA/oxaloacetate decarboxylase gamma subunit
MKEVYHILRLLEKIFNLLRKKAKWKALNPKTRRLCSRLLVCFLYSLIIMLGCGIAVSYEVPHVEIFQALGLAAVMVFTALGFLAMSVNFVGVVISRAERYQKSNPVRQKYVKRLFFSRSVAVCAASYRAGHARSYRRARSASTHASGDSDSSSDGGSDSGGDPPGSSHPVTPSVPFQPLYLKPNIFSSPWRFLRSPGYWRMRFCSVFAGRGWEK